MWTPQQPPPAAASKPAGQEPTPLSGIEVVAPNGTPKVVATYPAAGAAVPPGALVLMVRFDHRMRPEGFDWGPAAGQPPCLEKPRLLKDEKTFVLLCSAGFRASYILQVNGERKGFVDVAGTPAEPLTFSFTTTDAEPTADVAEALKVAGLNPVDSPILDSDTPKARGAP